jgi:hypothetical protein
MNTTAITPTAPTNSDGIGAGRITAIILGALLALVGIGALLGAGVLSWANATQRDSQGYFSTSTERFATPTYAMTSDRVDLNSGAGPNDWFVNNDNIATVRIRAKASDDVFVGIASQRDVDRYLADVAHDEITTVKYEPFSATYRRSPGAGAPALPSTETFWVAKSSGTGTRTLAWTPTQGSWAVVVMNADGTPNVNADIGLGVRVSFLGWIITMLSVSGVIGVLVGGILLVIGLNRSRHSGERNVYQPPQQAPKEASVPPLPATVR